MVWMMLPSCWKSIKKKVSVHRAPHLLCYRVLEVQQGTSTHPVPCIYGALKTLTVRYLETHWSFLSRERVQKKPCTDPGY